ncbi:hypothetical protein HY405_00980 [Candidatus Microgenomates bacterium]|nr:hypothetical protein [Candidatus Microgenomates bacterium]
MRTRGSSKLTSHKRKELILDLCRALSVLRSPQEVADALTDLLTPKEIETIAKRLQIAEYLVKGNDYGYIRSQLRVGYSTIARVNTWLNLAGEGFKIMLSRKKESPKIPSDDERYDPYSWYNIKRRYSMYFWPQLLIEEFIKGADRREKKKIHEIFEKLQLKGRRFNSEENKVLYEMFSSEIKVPQKK